MWDTFIINPMVNALLFIYSILGDFGVAIIVFTILIRLVTQPLTGQQMKSTQAMQELQKSEEWMQIAKKYKDDKQKLQTEQAKLFQAKGINPFGSCLPLLIQLPIIFGLYQSITRALAVTPLELLNLSKHIYPFINAPALIPIKSNFLWMSDLSQPERVNIFGIGIPLLAILVVITQYMQTKMMAMPTGGGSDQAAQMTKTMNIYMPLMMGWIAYSLAGGLAIYFVTTNVIGIAIYAVQGKLDWRALIPGQKALPASTGGKPAKTGGKSK